MRNGILKSLSGQSGVFVYMVNFRSVCYAHAQHKNTHTRICVYINLWVAASICAHTVRASHVGNAQHKVHFSLSYINHYFTFCKCVVMSSANWNTKKKNTSREIDVKVYIAFDPYAFFAWMMMSASVIFTFIRIFTFLKHVSFLLIYLLWRRWYDATKTTHARCDAMMLNKNKHFLFYM